MIPHTLQPYKTLNDIKDRIGTSTNSDDLLGLIKAIRRHFDQKRSATEIEEGFKLLMWLADRSPGKAFCQPKKSEISYWDNKVAEQSLHTLCRLLHPNFCVYEEDAGKNHGLLVLKVLEFFSHEANIPSDAEARRNAVKGLSLIYAAKYRVDVIGSFEDRFKRSLYTCKEAAIIQDNVLWPLALLGEIEQLVFNDEYDLIELIESYLIRKHPTAAPYNIPLDSWEERLAILHDYDVELYLVMFKLRGMRSLKLKYKKE